ncbi:hypothetical protein ACHWQZ_G009705 [Mnemiopsis leidyi]|uniref:SIX class homeobox transcription factor SIX13a n=1 Tax=Mnemiopsis leidyi TaxID=27923 RepID=E3UJV4_MNELE|nr:SIX class homeobox transcription factor SIX13a [Mnemiopsis leidyi]
MENYMIYNPIYPTGYHGPPYPVPAEQNVYISNYFLGNTTLEAGGGYNPYPRPHLRYPGSDLHSSYQTQEGKSQTTYHGDKFGSYTDLPKSEQYNNPEKTAEYSSLYPPDNRTFRDDMFGQNAQFDVWGSVKDEPVDSTEGQSSCVYSNNPIKSEKTVPQEQIRLHNTLTDQKENQIPQFTYHGPAPLTEQNFNYNQQREAALVDQIQEAHLQADHKRVMEMIATNCFSSTHHDMLQELWLSAVYGFAKSRRGKAPNAVDRYRLRKKYPFPATVWDGERTLYCYKQSARDQLEEFYQQNKYPTPLEKKELSERCDLTYMQVCNWFKNKRMRGKEQGCRQQRNS